MDSKIISDILKKDEIPTIEQILFTEKLTDNLSIMNLAYIYEKGHHPNGKNIEKAVELYEKSIKLKNTKAMHILARIYQSGIHPDGKNTKKAIKLYKKAIKLGNNNNINSMNNLAVIYYDLKNFKKAIELFEKATELGSEVAMYNLANTYYNGRHPDGKNTEKAFELYKKSFFLNKYESILKIPREDEEYEKMYNILIEKNKTDILSKIGKPLKKLTKVYGSLEDDCCICYNPLIGTCSGIVILECGHLFHTKCCKTYNCPVCRN
jgi:tetratricopeptide (TPR) repeat protein